jgi:hypothetical protein
METNLDALMILFSKHAARRSLRASVVRLRLLHISSGAVIPAPYQVRGKLQWKSSPEILDYGSSPE